MSVRKRHKECRIDVEYWMWTGLMLLDKTYPILFCIIIVIDQLNTQILVL